MTRKIRIASVALGTLGLLCLAPPATAQFTVDQSSIPTGGDNASSTENVDFADVDLDGDWDVALADGGDDGNDQNRLWINSGGAQGGTIGVFTDETTTRMPSVLDDSRDIEFVDFDDDGDQDLYTSNTAQIMNQSNRWLTNTGGGFYADETATRWIGLGGAGSSVPPSAVLPGGGFVDWSCDCDFGDLDNDGDMDLVHSSYGGQFGGDVPTRLFLNDGAGFFTEFNPSGFQLSIPDIANGDPGLWCEGTQQADTTDTTGASCDVASSALDIDVGDVDGDFDLDLLHGARQELPRMFQNRLEENGGVLGFRDVTAATFPPGYSAGNGHYEQEMGDLDGDGDLDVYGLNWQVTGVFGQVFTDITLENDGTGVYGNLAQLPSSGSDDNEGDFFDYDNDGDLDLYVANFSGQDRLYRNDGGAGFGLTQVGLPAFASTSLDADCADLDNDGDYDVLVAEDAFQSNTLLVNGSGVPDTTAPYVPRVEDAGTAVDASPTPVPVRAHVYDNAPYYVTWYDPTQLDVTVDGTPIPSIAMKTSGGQVFRGELPGNLVGTVSYTVRAEDEYGNSGSSAPEGYTGTTALAFANVFGASTNGNALGIPPKVDAVSVLFASSTLFLRCHDLAPSASFLFALTDQSVAPLPLPGLATLNVLGNLLLLTTANASAAGDFMFAFPVDASLTPGASLFAQVFGFDGSGADLLSSSQGLEVISQ